MTHPARKLFNKIRPKPIKCKGPGCTETFVRQRDGQDVCGYSCGLNLHRARETKALERKRRRLEKEQRAKDRQWKQDNKPLRTWIKEASTEFNKFIRIRDKHQACISCGASPAEIESEQGWKPGGAWDCGHFLSVGSNPALRFTEDNAHRQCKSCNGGQKIAQRFSSDQVISQAYEVNLINRIGQDRVDWLKGPHEPAKFTADDLAAIKEQYKLKAKELENYDKEFGI